MSHCSENGSEQGLGRLALLASGDRVFRKYIHSTLIERMQFDKGCAFKKTHG